MSVLNVLYKNVCPQSRLSSKSPVLNVACPQSLVLNVAVLNVFCPQCPIGLDMYVWLCSRRIISFLMTKFSKYHLKEWLCQVLDVACGTGVVGKEIREAGYTLVDGLDPSKAYLEGAMDRGIFRCFAFIPLAKKHRFSYQESLLQLRRPGDTDPNS